MYYKTCKYRTRGWGLRLVQDKKYIVLGDSLEVARGRAGWPRPRENRENREFGSYFFQTGKTQGILL